MFSLGPTQTNWQGTHPAPTQKRETIFATPGTFLDSNPSPSAAKKLPAPPRALWAHLNQRGSLLTSAPGGFKETACISWQHDKKRALDCSPSGFLLFLPVIGMTECSSPLLLLLLGGVIGAPNDVFSRVVPSPLDDHCCPSGTQPVPPPTPSALKLTFACALQMGWGLLDVSFVQNKQGGGARTELITAQVKSSQSRRGRLVGSPCTPSSRFIFRRAASHYPDQWLWV